MLKLTSGVKIMNKIGGLGRGLDSLLKPTQRTKLSDEAQFGNVQKSLATSNNQSLSQHVSLDRIYPSINQPRRQFNEEALERLSDSIRSQGVIQPITVRSDGEKYEIIAGERRWRAAQLAGVSTIPVIVRDDLDERTILAVALVENLQREDLNAIEEAEAIQKLSNSYHLTHEEIARSLGKSRSAITNILRLLDLEASVKQKVRDGQLKMGHVRPLLTLSMEQQKDFVSKIMEKKLSARQTEQAVKQFIHSTESESVQSEIPTTTDADIKKIQQQIRMSTSLNVRIKQRKNGGGEIIIPYDNSDLLASLINRYFK